MSILGIIIFHHIFFLVKIMSFLSIIVIYLSIIYSLLFFLIKIMSILGIIIIYLSIIYSLVANNKDKYYQELIILPRINNTTK